MTGFKTRGSKSGLYCHCGYAANLDEDIKAGRLEVTDDMDFSSSPYADLGTLIHNELQVALGCVMQTRLDEALDPMWANAAKLFRDLEECENAVEKAVNHGVSVFPKAMDGKAWVAEPEDALVDLTGHLDFESQDLTEIVDLKTTSRKPDKGRMKALHLYQLVSYWDLRGRKAKTGRILYLDSLKGEWALMSDPVDFDNPFIQEFAEGLKRRRKDIYDGVRFSPTPGEHCKSGFCSYRDSKACYASLVPPGGQVYVAKGAEKKSAFETKTPSKAVTLW